MASLTDILANIADNLPSGYHSATLTTAKLTALINERMRSVCSKYNFWWMVKECTQSTVDQQQRYDLPDGTDSDVNGEVVWEYKQDINVDLIDYQNHRIPLTRAIKGDIENDARFSDTVDKGIPSVYCENQDDIWLFPKPYHAHNSATAFTINIEYYGYPPSLSSTNTSNTFSQRYPKALEYGVTADAYRIGQDLDMSEYYETKFNDEIAEMVSADLEREFGGIEQGLTPVTGSSVTNRIQTVGGYFDGM